MTVLVLNLIFLAAAIWPAVKAKPLGDSWGSMPAGLFAGEHPALVDRWVLFAPIARREPPRYTPLPNGPAWQVICAEDQWNRFVKDVPAGEPPVLTRGNLDDWAERYLETDTESHQRTPVAVKTPNGPFIEILRAWYGALAYDPSLVRTPVAIVRGAWDLFPIRTRDGFLTPSRALA